MSWLLKLISGGVVEKFTSPLLDAYKAKLAATTDAEKLAADEMIASMEGARNLALSEAGDRWSATRLGRLLIVVPFGLWWACIYLFQIVNPLFGWSLKVIAVPENVHDMALILVPAIVIGDTGALFLRRLRK